MPRPITDLLRVQTATAHSDTAVYWLIEVEIPEFVPRRYRLVNNPEPIEFGSDSNGVPILYSPAAFIIRPIAENRENEAGEIEIVVGARGNTLSRVIDSFDGLSGQPIRILLISEQELTNTEAAIEFDGRILGASIADESDFPVVVLRASGSDLFQRTLPQYRFSPVRCGVKYGGFECGYTIPAAPGNTVGTGFDFCPRGLEDCELRGDDEVARGLVRRHPDNWLAFRGIPRGTVRPL